MNENKFDLKNFFEKYLWAIIGAAVALIMIIFRLVYFILCIALIAGFAVLGYKMQKNKVNIKEKLKAFIDKI
ncbi:MAG: hypothetical protein IKK43_06045 [Clostridia bacterium]|nr:hypothetical protein [Clostridia bacterium]